MSSSNQPAFTVADSGSGGTKLIKFEVINKKIKCSTIYECEGIKDMTPERLSNFLLEITELGCNIVGFTAWFRELSPDEQEPYLKKFNDKGIQTLVLTGEQEAKYEFTSIEYAGKKNGLPMITATLAAGGGSTQVTIVLENEEKSVQSIDLGFKHGIKMFMESTDSLLDIYRKLSNTADSKFQNLPLLRGNIVCISAVCYAAMACNITLGEFILAKDALQCFENFLMSNLTSLERNDKKKCQTISNLINIVALMKRVEPTTKLYFCRKWKVDEEDFLTTWSTGYFLENSKNLFNQNIPSWERKLYDMNSRQTSFPRASIDGKIPCFLGWKNDVQTILPFSKVEGDIIEEHYNEGTRYFFVLGGEDGTNLYMIFFHPNKEDFEFLDLIRNKCEVSEPLKDLDNKKLILANKGHIYVNLTSKENKKSPVRCMTFEDFDSLCKEDQENYHRYPANSKKDLVSLTRTLRDDGNDEAEVQRQMSVLLKDAEAERNTQKKFTKSSIEFSPNQHWVLYAHSAGLRALDHTSVRSIFNNMNGPSEVSIGIWNGKKVKLVSNTKQANLPEKCLYRLVQTDIDQYSNRRNLYIYNRIDLPEDTQHRIDVYAIFENLTTYQIDNEWSKAGYVSPCGLIPRYSEQFSKIFQSIYDIRNDHYLDNHRLYKEIIDILDGNDNELAKITMIRTYKIRCNLSMEKFIDPVIDNHGHTFEKRFILDIIQTTGKHPYTREKVSIDDIVEDLVTQKIMKIVKN